MKKLPNLLLDAGTGIPSLRQWMRHTKVYLIVMSFSSWVISLLSEVALDTVVLMSINSWTPPWSRYIQCLDGLQTLGLGAHIYPVNLGEPYNIALYFRKMGSFLRQGP